MPYTGGEKPILEVTGFRLPKHQQQLSSVHSQQKNILLYFFLALPACDFILTN